MTDRIYFARLRAAIAAFETIFCERCRRPFQRYADAKTTLCGRCDPEEDF